VTPEARFRTFDYEVDSRVVTEKAGELAVEGVKPILTSPPVEFKGEPGCWTPEHLFVSSLVACVLVRFLGYGRKEGLEFEGYNCRAVGRMVRRDGGWIIDRIELKARVEVKGADMAKKADEVLSLAKNNCPIEKSMTSEVVLSREIVDVSG